MNTGERRRLLGLYNSCLFVLCNRLADLNDRELDRGPSSARNARQIAHHLADTEILSSARLRLLLVGDDPYFRSFDEAKFSDRLEYERPMHLALALVRAARQLNWQLLWHLREEDWQRRGRHEEYGEFSIEDWLIRAANDAQDHLLQLHNLLAT